MLRRHGETWVLHGWANSVRDDYEDELTTEPTETEFQGIRNGPKEKEQRDEKGMTRWEMLDLLVTLSLALPPQTQEDLPVTLTSPEGRDYDLIGVDRSGAPVGSKRLKLKTGGADASIYL